MRYAIVMSLILLWMLLPAPVRADAPIGDASHCQAEDTADDARAYIRCIDAARDEALLALANTKADRTALSAEYDTHPDANPDQPYGDMETTLIDDEFLSYTYTLPQPYERYESVQDGAGNPRKGRVAYFMAERDSLWIDAGDGRCSDSPGLPYIACRLHAHPTWADGYRFWITDRQFYRDGEYFWIEEGLYVDFQRTDDGWRWRQFTSYGYTDTHDDNYRQWQVIAHMEDRDYRVVLDAPSDEFSNTVFILTDDCIATETTREGGLTTEHPRRCLPA